MDLFDIFGITEEELKDEKKASAKPKKKEKKRKEGKEAGNKLQAAGFILCRASASCIL